MLAEDNSTYGGQHGCEIEDAFADRGIGQSPLDVTVSGDGILYAGETGHWSTFVECIGGAASYEWAYREAGESGWTIIFGAFESTLDHSFCTDVTLRAVVTGNLGTVSDDYYVSVSGSCSNTLATGDGSPPGKPRKSARPDTLRIGDVTPTPAHSQARLGMALPRSEAVRVALYNTLGQVVARRRVELSAGHHEIPVEVAGLSTGTYFCRVTVGSVSKTRRLVVVR